MADENIMNTESEVIAETAETEVAEVAVAENEIAETIVVTHEHVEHDTTRAHNCDTGEEVVQHVTVETISRTPVEIAEDEAKTEDDTEDEDKDDTEEEVVAESEVASEENKEAPEEDKKECAEETPDWAVLIAELQNAIAELRNELSELRNIPENAAAVIAEEILSENTENETVVAESITGDAEDAVLMNPFMASISAPKKYSLLDKEEKSARKYSLLDRA